MCLRGRAFGSLALTCLACTAPNPAYWRTAPPDAEEELPADAAVVVTPPRADAAALPPPPEDTAPPPPTPDAAVSPDVAAADLAPAPDLARDQGANLSNCGQSTANITGINNADGVVIDTDGTLYFLTDDSTNSYVGRVEPGKMPQVKWLSVVSSPVTWGLALDSEIGRLYVVVVSGKGALVAYDDIKGTPRGAIRVEGLVNPNDAVVAPDGTVYFSVQGDRHIHWLSRDGRTGITTKNPVGSSSPYQPPSAVTLDPAGNLIVGLEHGGPIYQIVLDGNTERSIAPLGTWTGPVNGLTHDRLGRLYIAMYDDVALKDVLRLEADGMTTTKITSGGRFSSIAFGRGTLDCHDLYVADPFGPMRRVRVADAF